MKKILTVSLLLMTSYHLATAQIAENEGGGNGTTTAGGVVTVTTQNTIMGSVQFNAGDVNDYWWVDDGVSGTIIFTWSDDVRVFIRQYGNAGRTGAFESNTQVSSGSSSTLLASKFYAFFVQDNPAAQGFTSYSIAITGTALPAGGDSNPPGFDSGPTVGTATTSGFTVSASIDEGGDIYYVVVADGATAPTTTQVIAGQDNTGSAALASGNGQNLTDPFTLTQLVSSLDAGTAYDVYFVAQDDETSSNVQAAVTQRDITTLAPTSIQVAAKVFLQGAFNGSNGMNTTLEDADLVSASAPYNGTNSHAGSESLANAAAVPDGTVDWVLVELREANSAANATNDKKVGSAAGFLMNNGTIKATDGSSNLTISLSGNTGADFYVVVYHRNHLPIMSANAISESGGTYTIDFTSSSANTYQTTTALVSLTGGKFGMPAGDVDQDGDIDATDLSTWRTNNGAVFSYSSNGATDFNLDGVINAVDRNDFHQKNTSKTRQVPST